MNKHRIIVDLRNQTTKPQTVEAFELPTGGIYYRSHDDSLRSLAREGLFSGETYIVTAWHDDIGAAWAEAADELGRRVQALASIRLVCLAGQEVVNV